MRRPCSRRTIMTGALKLLKEAVKKDAELPPAHVVMATWFAQSNVPMGVRAALERAVVESRGIRRRTS